MCSQYISVKEHILNISSVSHMILFMGKLKLDHRSIVLSFGSGAELHCHLLAEGSYLTSPTPSFFLSSVRIKFVPTTWVVVGIT